MQSFGSRLLRAFVCLIVLCAAAFAADPVASVNFTGGEQGRILVQAKINDQGPFPFLFDTGSVNVVSLDLLNRLGIAVTGKGSIAAFGGSAQTGSATLDSIKLGELTMTRTELTVISGGPFTKGGPVGFLGWEFLSQLVVTIDYQHGRLDFYDPKTYTYTGRGERLPLTVREHNLLAIPTRVFGLKADVELDSGSESPLVLYSGFVREHHLHSDVDAITGYGFGGLTRAMVMRAPELNIGAFQIKSPVVHFSNDSEGVEAGALDGNIGGPLLREFTCVFDVPHGAFYIEPDGWFGKSPWADRSGLTLDTRGGVAKVLFVYPRSPAALVGIHPGDQLTDENAQPMTDFEWHDRLYGPPDATVRLSVQRDKHKKRVTLRLRDYL